MNRISTLHAALFCGAFAALLACAEGTDPNAVLAGGELPDGAAVDAPGSVLPATNPPNEDAGKEEDAAKERDAAPDAPVTSVACTSPNACTGATDLGAVSGDTGSISKTATGSGSQWFKIRVTEDDHTAFFGARLKVTAELTSPAGTNFDLFVYVAPTAVGQECSIVTASSTNTSTSDTAAARWDDQKSHDDSATVTVEVRHVSGPCTTNKWSLKVTGN